MCGIFGAVSLNPLRSLEFRTFITKLAEASEVRGVDAGGFCGVADGIVLADKDKDRISKLLPVSVNWRQLVFSDNYSLIGHTRASTSGAPWIIENNHPFHSDKYALVHNGVIAYHDWLAEKIKAKLKTKCDSEVLLHYVQSTVNLKNGIKKVYREIADNGSYAVAILNKENGEITLFRSMSSPAYVGYVPRWSAVIFASTIEIIGRAVRESMTISEKNAVYKNIMENFYQIEDGSIVTIKPNLEIKTQKIWASNVDDLYKKNADRRAIFNAIIASGVTSSTILKTAYKVRKSPFYDELGDNDKLVYNRIKDMNVAEKLRFWSDTKLEDVLAMPQGEYKAYMEFTSV